MGEYEPNDSRNVTGTASQMGQNEGNPNTNQGGQHWKEQAQQGQSQQGQGSGQAAGQQQQGGAEAGQPLGGQQLGHGQDPGWRTQAPSEQDTRQTQPSQAEGDRSPGQMGQQQGNAAFGQQGSGAGSGQAQQFQDGSAQMGGASGTGSAGGFAGQAAGGVRQQLREHMEVIGADGVHLGTVDSIDGDRIKLTKADSGMGSHQGHHHYLPLGLVAEVEENRVRLSANADVAWSMEQEEGGE